jgi:vancomycin permeability regulator SanA
VTIVRRALSRLPRPRLPATVRGRRRLLQAVMALAVLGLLPSAWLQLTAGDRVATVGDAPAAPVAVVFGAGLRPDGEPTNWLAHRLDAAAELYHSGRVRALLVTGDNGTADYDEPGAMRRYLVERHGVPGDRIVTDHAGFNTWNSCARARQVFGVTRALLVSQEFHIRRAVALCEAAGIDSWGVGVPEWRSPTWIVSGLREMAGAFTAAWDAAFTPAPRFAGPPDPSLREILAGDR